ncbi:hypothetical protein HPT27_00665 [Permianibacter sp. IMCC34836]|uniref:hypothetical protein n=1 Tax=Permianibacter fluminis TaxID=2738515 RepID=UPI001557BCB7|nr:hypothetical protein [Permianibacter fluminis]NQD35513.1 hypothetical protein [Permianibacter fluminis]
MEYYLKEPRHDLESSDLVAKVAIERSFLNVERSDGSIGSERTIYVAKVLSLWKGPLNPFIELTNAAPGARDFELGKQYLLFARLADDELYFAHWCGGTVDAVYASFKQSKLGTPSYDVQ